MNLEKLIKGVGHNDNGTQRVKESGTFPCIYKKDVPGDKKITYTQFCYDIQLQKDEINRTQLTVGGDRLNYDRKTSTETEGLKIIKIHLNSKI